MRQFLGAHSAADDMPALLAWWQDELQRSSSSAGQHSRQGSASTAAMPHTAQADPSTGANPDEMDVDGTPAATPAKRQLRARAGAQTPAGKTPGARGGQHGSGAAPLQAPVLVLQDADSVDADALEELVVALHEVRTAAYRVGDRIRQVEWFKGQYSEQPTSKTGIPPPAHLWESSRTRCRRERETAVFCVSL